MKIPLLNTQKLGNKSFQIWATLNFWKYPSTHFLLTSPNLREDGKVFPSFLEELLTSSAKGIFDFLHQRLSNGFGFKYECTFEEA